MKAIPYAIDYWAWSHALAIKRKARAHNLPTFRLNSTGRCCIFLPCRMATEKKWITMCLFCILRTTLAIECKTRALNTLNERKWIPKPKIFTLFERCVCLSVVAIVAIAHWLNGRCVRVNSRTSQSQWASCHWRITEKSKKNYETVLIRAKRYVHATHIADSMEMCRKTASNANG